VLKSQAVSKRRRDREQSVAEDDNMDDLSPETAALMRKVLNKKEY
jgi:hypothetical protein